MKTVLLTKAKSSHDEFVLVNNLKEWYKEYNDMKKNKKPKDFIRLPDCVAKVLNCKQYFIKILIYL